MLCHDKSQASIQIQPLYNLFSVSAVFTCKPIHIYMLWVRRGGYLLLHCTDVTLKKPLQQHASSANKFSPVKSGLALGVVGHDNRVSWYHWYNWPSTLPDTIMERGRVVWSGGRDWREKGKREKRMKNWRNEDSAAYFTEKCLL